MKKDGWPWDGRWRERIKERESSCMCLKVWRNRSRNTNESLVAFVLGFSSLGLSFHFPGQVAWANPPFAFVLCLLLPSAMAAACCRHCRCHENGGRLGLPHNPQCHCHYMAACQISATTVALPWPLFDDAACQIRVSFCCTARLIPSGRHFCSLSVRQDALAALMPI